MGKPAKNVIFKVQFSVDFREREMLEEYFQKGIYKVHHVVQKRNSTIRKW